MSQKAAAHAALRAPGCMGGSFLPAAPRAWLPGRLHIDIDTSWPWDVHDSRF
jgi:hypothetical protein